MCTNNSHANDSRVEVFRRIIWLSRRHFQLNTARLEETGLGSGQLPVLLELSRWGEMNQRELADRVRVTPATISGMLKRMEKAGFISRTADENDARVSLVRLTEEGRAQCETAKQLFDQTCHQMLKDLSDAECTQLKELLERVDDIAGGAPCCRTENTKKE